MKKYLAVILSLIIVLSSVSFCFAATPTTAQVNSGTYTGTGSSVTIDCGFQPKLIVIQCTDPASGTTFLAGFTCDQSGASSISLLGASTRIDFTNIKILSTGFKAYSSYSVSGSSYSWVAIG